MMWELKAFWLEIVMRSTILFVLVLFRLRNRVGSEISPIDQVVLITVGNLTAAAAIKSDDSMSAAAIAITTFMGLTILMNYLAYKTKIASDLIEGVPKVLVHNGKISWENMKSELLETLELNRL
ncbi:MAG: hypothetical protein C0507_14970 [Cyanobacteria bacterium PR.3.49]|nr:hypothetical protein [Cyanobacteria bacterium PR.3.49]